jgi:transcriptional regulator with XRE-family HTH domain
MSAAGKIIKELREQQGMSQQQLADQLQILRPAISAIEGGTRNVTSDELVRLAQIFNVSVDYLVGLEKKPKVTLPKSKPGPKAQKRRAKELRINVPQKNLDKFKEVLLYLLSVVGAKPNVGETVLYKLLYFIDFDFYEKYEEQLVGATYIKNHFGPSPVEFQNIAERMIEDGEIERFEVPRFDYAQKKYIPLRHADLSKLDAREKQLIDDVLGRLSDMGARQISEYSHNDIPWLTAEDGARIEYEAVFYRTPQYSVRGYDDEEGDPGAVP